MIENGFFLSKKEESNKVGCVLVSRAHCEMSVPPNIKGSRKATPSISTLVHEDGEILAPVLINVKVEAH